MPLCLLMFSKACIGAGLLLLPSSIHSFFYLVSKSSSATKSSETRCWFHVCLLTQHIISKELSQHTLKVLQCIFVKHNHNKKVWTTKRGGDMFKACMYSAHWKGV